MAFKQEEQQRVAAAQRASDGEQALRMHSERHQVDIDSANLWQGVSAALLAAGPHTIDPPGVRTNKVDFVRQGRRMRGCGI